MDGRRGGVDENPVAGVQCWEMEITSIGRLGYVMVGVCKADVRPESGTESLHSQQGKAWMAASSTSALARSPST